MKIHNDLKFSNLSKRMLEIACKINSTTLKTLWAALPKHALRHTEDQALEPQITISNLEMDRPRQINSTTLEALKALSVVV